MQSAANAWGVKLAAVATAGILSACTLAAQPVPGPRQGPMIPAAPAVTGSVTGQVIAQDTQLPARFAQVSLQSVSFAGGGEGNGGFRGGFGGSGQATTGVDGTFAIDVAPGDYYVTAWAPGYIPERSLLLAQVTAGANPADLLAQIPVVHVGAQSVSSVTVTMQRGATLAGRIVWEDGSPASGVSVSAPLSGATITLPDPLQQIRSPGSAGITSTDDRGAFRISGLAAGDYLLQAVIPNRPQFGGFVRGGQSRSAIRLYVPGVFHKADAKPISLHAADERDDVRLVIDLRGLRSVSGQVASVTAGLSVASGRVTLIDPTDNSLSLTGAVNANGEFKVEYVPPGNYTLQVSGASTQPYGSFRGRGGSQGSSVSFQPFSVPVTVSDTDVTGVQANLTPVQTSP